MGYLAEHPDDLCVGDTDENGDFYKRKPTAAEIQQELDNEPTPEEIAAEEARRAEIAAANQKLLDFEYLDLQYWQKTDAELDTLINGMFNSSDPAQIALSCRAVNKQLAKGIADIIDIIAQLRTMGIIPK